MIINIVYVNKYSIQDIKQILIFYFWWAFCPLAIVPNGRIVINNYIFVIILFCNVYKFSES